MEFLPLLPLAYLVGMVVAGFTYLRRCGLRELAVAGIGWREFLMRNPLFFLWMYTKIIFWLPVLLIWLVTGMPACPWQATISIDGRPARKIAWVGFTAEVHK
ncbi:hypothetical protein [Actinokineospora sp.]|uniref:hypothetical protein n=1 Tax=Actinokineospora sp. TaxID=1872133 RepID=UPI004037F337